MRNSFLLTLILLATFQTILHSQHSNSELPLSINEDGAAPDSSAIVDIQSTDKGLLIPRMPFCDIEKISNPAEGLMVYDTEFHCLRIYIQGTWQCLYQKMTGPGADASITGWSNPTYDEDYNSGIALDSEENVYVTMSTDDGEIRLTKFDNKGNILWTIFENSGGSHHSPVVDMNDYVYTVAAGSSFNGLSFSPASYFLTKTSPDGASSSVYALPGASIGDLATDTNGNLFFAFAVNSGQSVTIGGTTYTDVGGSSKIGVVKMDSNFNIIWTKVFDVYSDFTYFPLKLAIDDAGDVYLTGHHNNGIELFPIDPAEIKTYNVYLCKLSGLDGTHFWTQHYGTDDSDIYSADVKVADFYAFWGWQSGDNVQVGAYSVSNGDFRYRYDPSGSERWLNFDVNEARNEIAITFIPSVDSWYTTPARVLIYTYSGVPSVSIPRVHDQTFYRPGKLTFNASGSRIYGIGEGTVVGNTVIGQNGENHIIYKFINP